MLYQSKTENGIQLLQLRKKSINKYKKVYRNEQSLQNLPQETQEVVLNVFRDYNLKRDKKKSRLKILSLFYVNPQTIRTGLWDLFVIGIIYFFQIQISLTLGFGPQYWDKQLQSGKHLAGYICCLIILALDIIINFHKGYYAFGRGKVIDEPELIIKHYLKIYFAMDLVTIIILTISMVRNGYFLNYMQLIPAVLLYFKKFKNQGEIVSMLQYQKKLRVFFILVMLGCDVLLIGHFGACIFVGLDLLLWKISYYGNNPQYYWLSNNSMYPIDLIGGSWVLQYIYAQSFSTGTLSTIAPGPFGKNPIQIFYSILVMIFFMILASYVAQVLVSILLSEDQIRTFHEDNIQKFDRFMKLKGVAEKINRRVHNFFELIWEAEIKMNAEDEKQVLQKLPVLLKEELLVEMGFVKNLKLMRFFSNGELLIRLMSLKISTIVIDADTTLFSAGSPPADIDQRYLYHFKDGLAKFFIAAPTQQVTLALSNVQRNVGQFQFVTGLAYSYSCKSVDLCIVSRVANADLLEAITENRMIQQYQALKFKLLLENQLDLISKVCIVCQENHTEDKCMEIYPSLEISQSSKGNFIEKKNERKSYKRKLLKSIKVRMIEPRAIAKAHIVLMFLTYKGLSGLIINLSQSLDFQLDRVQSYEKFYPQYNM